MSWTGTMSRICGNIEACVRWECPALTGAPDIRRWSLLTRDPGELGTLQLQDTYGPPAPDTGPAAAGENIQTRFCLAMMRWWYDHHELRIHVTRCITGHHPANLLTLNTLHHPLSKGTFHSLWNYRSLTSNWDKNCNIFLILPFAMHAEYVTVQIYTIYSPRLFTNIIFKN